jgi:hypothetical protein
LMARWRGARSVGSDENGAGAPARTPPAELVGVVDHDDDLEVRNWISKDRTGTGLCHASSMIIS